MCGPNYMNTAISETPDRDSIEIKAIIAIAFCE